MTEAIDTVIDTETPEPTRIEAKALAMGWKPVAEFEGDEEDFVDAKEFVGRERLYNKLYDQNKKLSDMEKTLQATASHVTKMGEVAYKRALSELKKERSTAIESADVKRVHEIDGELDELKESVVKEDANNPPQEFTDWVGKNDWFTKDEELYGFACATYDAIVKKNPSDTDIEKTLQKVTSAVKKAYPDKFDSQQRTNSVEGRARPTNFKTGASYTNLTSEQKRVCDTFVKSGVMTKDAYVKSLVDIGEL
jgi:hypothetical protein